MAKKGVNQLSDVLDLAFSSISAVAEELKDGAQITDAYGVMKNTVGSAEWMEQAKEALKGIEEVPAELSDLSFDETMGIGMKVFMFLKSIAGKLGGG